MNNQYAVTERMFVSIDVIVFEVFFVHLFKHKKNEVFSSFFLLLLFDPFDQRQTKSIHPKIINIS